MNRCYTPVTMHTSLILLTFLLSYTVFAEGTKKPTAFRLHLIGETYSLDPAKVRGSSGSYLFHNLHRGLYSYDRESGLVPEGAKSCHWKSTYTLECELNKKKWSDGSPITPEDYIRTFRRLLSKELRGSHAEMLMSLKNAKEVFLGSLSPQSLGVTKYELHGKSFLRFHLHTEDSDFEYKLAQYYMAPTHPSLYPKRKEAHKLISSGPYKIKKWNLGSSVELEANPHYDARPDRPLVEMYFIEDDSTALRLYESDRLSFLRRLPAHFIGKYRGRKDFYQIPIARFDMIGFGPSLKQYPKLRELITRSPNYQQLKIMLWALGKPGCPSLPRSFMASVPCYTHQPMEAKTSKDSVKKPEDDLNIGFSKMGGEDIRRQMEWFQGQWKKFAGLKVNLKSAEQGMYINTLRSSAKPDLFRKGMSLDVPTCLNALETLTPGHPENYIEYNNPKFTNLVGVLRKTTDQNLRKSICSQAMQVVMDDHVMIPLGEIHYTILAKANWTGWRLNELNQMDLSDLKLVSK